MSQDEQGRAALALLRQAGRLDLLREEAPALGRPTHRASAGVTAAVMACSPPRAGAACLKVRRSGIGAGGPSREGTPWEGHGRDGRRNLGGRGPRASRGAGRPQATLQLLGLERKGRGSPIAVCSPTKAGVSKSNARAGRSKEFVGAGKGREGEGNVVPPSVVPHGTGVGRGASSSEAEGDGGQGLGGKMTGPRYPRVPISRKWPTMLQWSSSDKEEGQEPGRGGPQSELGAARSPWEEGKVRPGADGRITSAGWRGEQREAAEVPSGQCGGVGLAPPNAGARGNNVQARQVCDGGGEWGRQAVKFAGDSIRVVLRVRVENTGPTRM
ncbi:hypothetical protein NDU88_003977 [Pleurodeles waltl]|uniref:Uncharacterized protein n=1 Tax=Pleurodeles waltl TaxID=8319 RepID=A0AAV7TPY4_PLEWA|nr:hypothetical protein NDU88_003977 [Pleurodeles waltl]